MQDDPPQDELDESQSESSDVDDNDATEISESETEKPNTGDADSNGVEEPPQSLLLGDSLAGDIESIVASDIFVDEGLASIVLETDGSGSLLVQGSELKDNKEISGIESSGIIDSDSTIEGSDVGSLSREAGNPFGTDYARMTFWEFLFGGVDEEIKAWDVDLGEYLNDGEDDPDAATMLGTANEFDLDASGIIEEEIKSTDGGSSESEIHYGTKRFLQAFFPFAECWFSGGVEARDVDLGEFLNDGVGDPVPTFTLKTFFEQDVQISVLALVCFLVVVFAIVLLFCMYFGYI